MKTQIVVLYGGKSVEHEVSLQTAYYVLNALDREKYHIYPVYITKEGQWCSKGLLQKPILEAKELQVNSHLPVADSIAEVLKLHFSTRENVIAFPLLHGTNGEDGTVQGLLELLDIPYVGNGVLSSAIGIDKEKTKQILHQAGILQAQYITVQESEANIARIIEQVEEKMGYPCYIKPARLGSSVGINRCTSREEMHKGIREAFKFDHKLIIEPEIIGREMQVAVLGNESPKASVVGEYLKERAFMDYEAKYVDGKLIPVIPAELPFAVQHEMRRLAVEAFKALNATGLLRVDFFVTNSYELIVNEVNTLPGFTAYSMFPALWEKTNGTSYAQLLESLIQLARERYERQHSRNFVRC